MPKLSRPFAFRREDVWLHGNVFQRRDVYDDNGCMVFVHRSMPSVVFEFCGYRDDMSKRLRPFNGTHYYIYRQGSRQPVRTRERILPVDTEERRCDVADYARQERAIKCALCMKYVRGEARLWL